MFATNTSPLNSLKINQQLAQRQMEYLGYKRSENVYLRFFYHSNDPRKNDDKGRKSERLCWDDIERYQQDGRGVYLVVNGASGGHEDKNIKQCPAIFCEWDDRSVEEQLRHWETVGFFEPTFTVFSGDRSTHPYWVFNEPLNDVEQWRELQQLLIEVMGADPANKNPSRVFRLAGGWHVQPGRVPVQTEIVQDSAKKYSAQQLLERLREIRQQQQPQVEQPTLLQHSTSPTQQQSNQRFTRSEEIMLPVPESVPLEVCLSKDSRSLLQSGVSVGGRNANGAKLARDLIGTANYLQSIGQLFNGTPWQLFLDYCQQCPASNGWNEGEWKNLWKSAENDHPTPSCQADGVETCIRAWYWKHYIKPNQSGGDRLSNVVLHPTGNQPDGDGNSPQPLENPYELVKALVCSGMSQAHLSGALIELSTSKGYQLGGLQSLARDIEVQLSSQSAQSDDAKETNKLLEYREQTLDLKRVFPAQLATYLLTKATSDQVDPVFMYQYLWSAIGLSLGAHIGIEGKNGATLADSWVEFPIYYNMTVGLPSVG